MKQLLAIICLLGLISSPIANAADMAIRLTGVWQKIEQRFVAMNTQTGEYKEAKRDAKLHYELRGDGFFAAFNQDKDFTDNKVLGVELAGTSSGNLIEDGGKYYWQLVRESKDKAGKVKKVDEKWEVVFASGDWQTYQKGDDVELTLTKASQDAWNKFHTEIVVKFADDLRNSYVVKFPDVNIAPVAVEKITHKKAVTFAGNLDEMTINGGEPTLIAKVVVTL